MIPLIKLKQDVQFNKEFTLVVDVMKGIATSKFYQLQKEMAINADFDQAVQTLLSHVPMAGLSHPFVEPRNARKGVLLVTSDTGFLGGLNANVVHSGLAEGGGDAQYVVVGERGIAYMKQYKGGIEAFPGIVDDQRYAQALAVRDHMVKHLARGSFGRLSVVYARPELDRNGRPSFTQQRVVVEEFIPVSRWIPPHKGLADNVPLWWESDAGDVLQFLVGKWMGQRLYEIFALSRLAELGARAMHLEGSYQELQRRGKRLNLQYQRARHEIIDRSMREIFAAQILSRRKQEAEELEAGRGARGLV